MFCPKCGSQNTDETRFCRGCGQDLGNVLAVMSPATAVQERPSPGRRGVALDQLSLREKEIELWSGGWRGLIGGVGFLIVAGLGFGLSERTWVMGFFGLVFAFVFLATCISRFVQASGLKRLREQHGFEPGPALAPGHPDYIQPSRSLFTTEDLAPTPGSVTEHTTTRLELDRDTEKR